ncbi:myrosinase 1-like [Diabrotica undecimpunctata]|uniref:myrosinase 1-like n=1 Tax=Diabrotica undecimpunctata TaxID=50387 RepID=UPI003B63C656
MGFKYILLASLLVGIAAGDDIVLNKKRFPKDFMFGVSTAAYQIEGAWNEDGKGETNWDHFAHQVPSPVYNGDTGDVACDSYHKIKEDVALLKYLGVKHYRFSISWARILPTGYINKINQAGINYYKSLLKELKANNIIPIVTLLHFDTPQPIEEIGGWLNEWVVDRYVEYAEVCFKNFGEDVQYWTTFNEPVLMCIMGYGIGVVAPGRKTSGIGEYLCAHNVIRAHAKVFHKYKENYNPTKKGLIGISLVTAWNDPKTDKPEDIEAANRLMLFTFGWFAHPIVFGSYPQEMEKKVGNRSSTQGYSGSRHPGFTDEESAYIAGTADYFGINYYTSVLIEHYKDEHKNEASWSADTEVIQFQPPEWEDTIVNMFKVYPQGIYKLVKWVSKTYNNIPIIITENGYPDDGSTLEDDKRISYIKRHLSKLRDALDEGVNLIGYTYWSFMDNFEWLSGYSVKFGVFAIDFNSPNRTRTPRKSAEYLKNVYATRCIMEDNSQCSD